MKDIKQLIQELDGFISYQNHKLHGELSERVGMLCTELQNDINTVVAKLEGQYQELRGLITHRLDMIHAEAEAHLKKLEDERQD